MSSLRTCAPSEDSLPYTILAVATAKLLFMDEGNDIVDRLVKLAVEVFDIVAQRTSRSAGDIFTALVTIPGGGAETPIMRSLASPQQAELHCHVHYWKQ